MSHHPVEIRTLEDGRTVQVMQHYPGEWTANDSNYDGPESPMGYGKDADDAVGDLLEKIGSGLR